VAPGTWDWLVDYLLPSLRGLLLDDVRRFIANPIEALLYPLRRIGDRVSGALWPLGGIGPLLSGMISTAGNTIRHALITSVVGAIWGIPGTINAVQDALRRFPGTLLGGMLGPLWNVGGGIQQLPHALLSGMLGPLWNLGGGLQQLPHALLAGMLGPLWNVGGGIQALATTGVSTITRPLWDGVAMINSGQITLAQLPRQLETSLRGLLADIAGSWERLLSRFWVDLTIWAGANVNRLEQEVYPGLERRARGLSDTLMAGLESGLTAIQGFVLGPGTITPEMAPAIGTRAFGTAVGLGVSSHLLSTLVEFWHPTHTIGLHYLSGFLAQMGSYAPIANAIMGTTIQVGVATPMRFYLNARTRVSIPTPGDLQGMHRKHTLSPAKFGQNMAYWGYSEDWIRDYIEYLPADPRLFDILRMAEAGFPDTTPPSAAIPTLEKMGIQAGGNPDWWLQMKFALAGYNWIDIPMLVDTVHRRETSSERGRLATTASVNFRNGYMTEAQYRQELQASGMTAGQIDWKVRAEQLSALRDDINDLEKLFVDRYLKDMLTYDDLLVALVNVGVTPHKSDILANRALIRKLPKVTDPTAKIEEKATREMQVAYSRMYKEQYRNDLISSTEYHSSLRAIGISESVAWATVQLEVARRIGQTDRVAVKAEARAATRTQAAQLRLYREQFRAGLIDHGRYHASLLDAGVSHAEADAIADAEAVRLEAQARTIAAAAAAAELAKTRAAYSRLYQLQVRAGAITFAVYLHSLIALGVPPGEAQALMEAERTRYDADLAALEAREAAATARAAQRAQERLQRERYDAGAIDGDQYLEQLLAIGIEGPLARATVQLAEVQRFGLLERAELKAEEKLALQLQRTQAALYTRRFRAGELSEAQYLERLIAVGIPELLAAATVELEAAGRVDEAGRVRDQLIIPALKIPWAIYVKRLRELLEAGEITMAEYTRELIASGLAEDVAALVVAVTS